MCVNDPFDYQVINLTPQFYIDYPDPPYHELIRKNSRPYNCLLIQSHYGYFICIPYRSNVTHKYSFRFKNSARSKKKKSGLDFSKMVIIQNLDYLSNYNAIVDADEYAETRTKIEYIKNDALTYVDDYVNHILNQSSKYDKKTFQRIYQYSTLQYFHKELGI